MKRPFAALFFSVLALSAYGAKIEYEAPNGIPPVESPAGRLDWNLDRAYSEKSGERLRISLNTYWNFLPCDSADRTIPPDDAAWGVFHCPRLLAQFRSRRSDAYRRWTRHPEIQRASCDRLSCGMVPENLHASGIHEREKGSALF